MEYAGFFRRAFGLIIDAIVVGTISFLLMLIGINAVALGLLIGFLYQPIFECSALQATPGKYLMDMKITDLDGGRITFKAAIIRYFVRFVSGALLCLGYFVYFFTEKHQTLHDLAAETVVTVGPVVGVRMFEAWYQQFSALLGIVDRESGRESSSGSQTSQPSSGSASGFANTGFNAGSSNVGKTSSMKATPADLAGLYELYQKGILTEAEYNQKRAEILKNL
jgi:uncharacterized RDD family membrane protein YckC